MHETDGQPLIAQRVLAAFAGMMSVSVLDTLGLLPTNSSAMIALLYGVVGAGGGWLVHESTRRFLRTRASDRCRSYFGKHPVL